jgi:putative transposase
MRSRRPTTRRRTKRRVASTEPQPRGLQGRRFTDDQKQHALVLVAAKMKREQVASVIGTTTESLRRWVQEAARRGAVAAGTTAPVASAGVPAVVQPAVTSSAGASSRSVYAPKDPAQGLSDAEVAAILELKREHPSYGPAQLRAQLKRFKGWRLANRAIARVLKKAGYELVHKGSRPQGPEPVRFEAPRRNALWQADFTELRVGDEKLHLLVILDDFSRYVVAHQLCDSPSAEVTLALLRQAIARHGKPEAVRTDRGGAFSATGDFGKALENELIDHIVGHSYHPQGGGKVEAVMGTVKRELWDVEHFDGRPRAERRLVAFFEDYNEHRAHMGIDGLTPADRYFGRADRVLARIDAISRRRNGARVHEGPAGGAVEESTSGPLEVLRLVAVDGQMELRLLGARVLLGPVLS